MFHLRSEFFILLAGPVQIRRPLVGLVFLDGCQEYGLCFFGSIFHDLRSLWRVSLSDSASSAADFSQNAQESTLKLPQWTRLPAGTLAVLSIVIAGVFHGLKPRAGALAQNAVVLLKLALIGVILLFAVSKLPTDSWLGSQNQQNELSGWSLASAFARSLVWISLSYAGFNAAVYIAGEVDSAKQMVPKTLLAGTSIVVVLYILLNAVFVYGDHVWCWSTRLPGRPVTAGRARGVAAQSLNDAKKSFDRWASSHLKLSREPRRCHGSNGSNPSALTNPIRSRAPAASAVCCTLRPETVRIRGKECELATGLIAGGRCNRLRFADCETRSGGDAAAS